MSRWSLPSRTSNTCLKIANFWRQYNDHVHDLLTYTYIFLLKPTFDDIWFIWNCILMAIILTWYLSICQVSSCPPLWGDAKVYNLRSREVTRIAIVRFRLHRMYTQLPILSIYVLGCGKLYINFRPPFCRRSLLWIKSAPSGMPFVCARNSGYESSISPVRNKHYRHACNIQSSMT